MEVGADGKSKARIWRAIPQIRTDRRKDRVEPSHKQLSDCISTADTLSRKYNVLTRVIGWYHSHPNITVLPSHVDLRTQAQHQALDSGFVGMIISCFNKDQVLKCTAFQTLAQDEFAIREDSFNSMDEDIQYAKRISMAEYNRSNIDLSRTTLGHKEIPLRIIKPSSSTEQSLKDCATLHQILCDEERLAYQKAADSQKKSPISHSLIISKGLYSASNVVRLHEATVYSQSLLRLINNVLTPNLNSLIVTGRQNSVVRSQIKEKIEYYTNLAARLGKTKPTLSEYLEDFPSLLTDLDYYPQSLSSQEWLHPTENRMPVSPQRMPPRFEYDSQEWLPERTLPPPDPFSISVSVPDGFGRQRTATSSRLSTGDRYIVGQPQGNGAAVSTRPNQHGRAHTLGYSTTSDLFPEQKEKSITTSFTGAPSGDQFIPFVTFPPEHKRMREETRPQFQSGLQDLADPSLPRRRENTQQSVPPVSNSTMPMRPSQSHEEQRPQQIQRQRPQSHIPQTLSPATLQRPSNALDARLPIPRFHVAGHRRDNRLPSPRPIHEPLNDETASQGGVTVVTDVPRMETTNDYLDSSRPQYPRRH